MGVFFPIFAEILENTMGNLKLIYFSLPDKNEYMRKGLFCLAFLLVTQICCAQFSLRSDQSIKLACDNAEEKVVQTALKLFIRDYQSVFSASAAVDARQETGFSFADSAGWLVAGGR